jgi:flagellar assembly factor FliW
MLILAEPCATHTSVDTMTVDLPCGLIGLPGLKSLEVSYIPGSWPFLNLRSVEGDELNFLAIEPRDIIPGYRVELNDVDTAILGLESEDDALVLNIATVHSLHPQYVTVNLIGPVVINRRTNAARQVIIVNSEGYSPRYALIDERVNFARA